MTLDQIETVDPRRVQGSRACFSSSGAERSAAAGFAARPSARSRSSGSSSKSKLQFAMTPRWARVDALAGKVSISPILSWRAPAFIEEYADDSFDLPKREPIERAVIGFLRPQLLDGRRGVHQEEHLPARVSSLRLAAQRSDRRATGLDGSAAARQSGHRDGIEPGVGSGEREALAAEGCRVCLCARGAEALEAGRSELRDLATRPVRVNPVITVAADLSSPEGAREGGQRHACRPSAASTSSSTTSAPPRAPTSSTRSMPSGRRRSITRSIRPSGCRGSSCRTCAGRAAERL